MIAGYHWFTDWGRDTMISLEGLTLATGRSAEAGYILRTFAHYVRDGLIPNLFPEGENRGPVPHGRRDALVLPRARPLPRDRPTTASTLPRPAPRADRHRRAPHRGHAVRHRRRPRRRPAAPGGRGLPAHLDGRQGGRLGGHAAAGQGRRDQRALVQRPAAAGGLGAARLAADDADAGRYARHAEQARASFNDAVLVRRRGLPVRRGRRRARRRPGLPAQPALRHLAAASGARPQRGGSRCWTSCSERLLTPVGLRSLAPGHPDYKAALLRRPARPRRGLPPGHGLGLADRPVHRRLAEGPPRRPRRRPPASSTAFAPHLERGGPRHDQRDLRRRAAVHTPRLHRPGLERRRGAARLGQDASSRV